MKSTFAFTRNRVFVIVAVMLMLTIALPASAQEDSGEAMGNGTFEPAACAFEPFQLFVEGENLECGFVTVPEEHANPDGPTIRVAVARIASNSANPAPDPLFIEQGGPGGSTLDLFGGIGGQFILPFLDERDVILVEQRGTLYSEPSLVCTEGIEVSIEALDEQLTIEESQADLLEILDACVTRLEAEGVNFSAFDSVENAADMVAVADAFGVETFNFYGVSYGTMLGQHLIRDFEDRLRSVILDAVVPLEFNFIPDVAVTTDRALDVLFETCAADAICAENFPDLENVLFETVELLDENPFFFETLNPETEENVPAIMTGEYLLSTINMMLYSTQMLPNLPQFIYDTANGDLTWAENYYGSFLLEPLYTSATAMQMAVLCAEDADFNDTDYVTDDVRERVVQNQSLLPGTMPEICDIMGVEELGDFADAPIMTDLPVLLTSGEFDPITPPSYAAMVEPNMPNSTNLTFPGVGHGALLGGQCGASIMTAFISDPTAEVDASCIDTLGVSYNIIVGEPKDLVRFAQPLDWEDISTEDFASYTNADINATISIYAAETGEAAIAIEEALPLVVGEGFAGTLVQSETVDAGSFDITQNVYVDGTNLVLALAIPSDANTAIIIIEGDQAAFLQVDPALTPLLNSLLFTE